LVLTIASGFGEGLFISIWTLWLNDLHASNSFIGLTFITFSLPLMLLMPSTGKMADKYRLAPLIAIPGAMISFVYFTYGVTENLFIIAAIGLLEGTFIAIMIPALSAYVANLSPDNARGRLQGIISTTRTLAGFASAMVVTFLYSIDSTYPFFMLAAVQIVISITGGLLVWTVEKRTNAVEEAPGPPATGGRGHALTPQLEAAAK
jgi:DHA1 family multidrug resistance protein-like MFS transporter